MPPQKRETYRVIITFDVEIATPVLDAAMKPDWQNHFYKMTRAEVAGMIGSCLHRGLPLDEIDGFADRNGDEARIVPHSTDVEAEGS